MKKLQFILLLSFSGFLTSSIKGQVGSVALISSSGTNLYSSITSAYSAIPSSPPAGSNYIIELLPAYNGNYPTEIYPISLGDKSLSGGSNITIRPAVGNTSETIQRPVAAAGNLIQINGGKNIIIDGRPGGITSDSTDYLNVVDVFSGANNSNINLINGASNNTIKYINATASLGNLSLGNRVILITSAAGGPPNNHNIISNNVVSGGNRGIAISGGTVINIGNEIRSNTVKDFIYGIFGGLNSQDSTTIENNTIICTGLNGATNNTAILHQGETTISNIINNTITSNITIPTINVMVGIQYGSFATVGTVNIANNTITNFIAPESCNQLQGIITSPAGNCNIKNNTISNFFAPSANILGIFVQETGASVTNVSFNKITSIGNDNFLSVKGISIYPYLGGGTATVSNNFVSIVDPAPTPSFITGIELNRSFAGINTPHSCSFYFNTIRIGGIQSDALPGDISAVGISKLDDYPGLEYHQKNNICIIDRTGAEPGAIIAGFFLENVQGTIDIDHNTYYGAGVGSNSNSAYWVSGSYGNTQEADYKLAAMPHEQHSNFTNVNFQSNTDLHLSGTSQLDLLLNGTPIAGIAVDIDNDPRKAAIPTRGGDENLITVPVRFLSLNGEAKDDFNEIHWTTAFEQHNVGFEILHSPDGINFVSTGFINTKALDGNSDLSLNYSFTDTKPLSTSTYYKLKQIDKNQKITFSGIIKITRNGGFNFEIIKCFPNPATEYTSILMTAPQNGITTISITDISGNKLLEKRFEVKKGENLFSINTRSFNKGSFIIKAALNNKTVTSRFIKS